MDGCFVIVADPRRFLYEYFVPLKNSYKNQLAFAFLCSRTRSRNADGRSWPGGAGIERKLVRCGRMAEGALVECGGAGTSWLCFAPALCYQNVHTVFDPGILRTAANPMRLFNGLQWFVCKSCA